MTTMIKRKNKTVSMDVPHLILGILAVIVFTILVVLLGIVATLIFSGFLAAMVVGIALGVPLQKAIGNRFDGEKRD